MRLGAFFLVVVLGTTQVRGEHPLCFNGALTVPQSRSIDAAREQIEALSHLTDGESLNNETAALLYGPPIVVLNDRQTKQTKEVFAGLFTQRELPSVEPMLVPAQSNCRDERRVYRHGAMNYVQTTRVCSPVQPSVSYRSQYYGGRPVGVSTRTTRYRTVQTVPARTVPAHTVPVQRHTVPIQQQAMYRAAPRRARRAAPRRQFEIQICRDPEVVRESINYARDTQGNLVQIAQLHNEYQAIENEPECPMQLGGLVARNIICKRKWVDVPAVVIPLRGGPRRIQLRDIRVPRCFAHVIIT